MALVKLARIEITYDATTCGFVGVNPMGFMDMVDVEAAAEYDIDGDELTSDLALAYHKFPGADVSIGIIHKVI